MTSEKKKSYGVSKIIIQIKGSSKFVLSRKNAKGKSKYNKLEFLGGNLEKGEEPLCGLVRELCEEERSGIPILELCKQKPIPVAIEVGNKPYWKLHYMYKIEITHSQYKKLEYGEEESLGFELISNSKLYKNEFQSELTKMTKGILKDRHVKKLLNIKQNIKKSL